MLLEKLGIFILFLGPLVFFHELGHFFFARLFGVRVEVFSIGFGPKILKFKKGDTTYAVSLIPLGGYVKMFGDDPLNKEAIPLAERQHSFTFKGKWARFWIVMGGPLANFIMAYVIFFSLLMTGERLPELKIGVIPESSDFYSYGLRSGDIITKVNSKRVYNPTDILLKGDDLIKTMSVRRYEKEYTVTLNLTGESFFQEFAKYPPTLRYPVVVNQNGKTFIASLKKEDVNWDLSYDQLKQNWSSAEPFYLFPVKIDHGQREREEIFKVDYTKTKKLNLSSFEDFDQAMYSSGFVPLDLNVKKVNPKYPGAIAGLENGDSIIGLDGKKVFSFEQLRENLQKSKKNQVELTVWRDGQVKKFDLEPKVENHNGNVVKLIGVHSGGIFQAVKFIETQSRGFVESAIIGLSRTWESVAKTVEGFKKLLTAEVSFKTIGGPLSIGKVASDSFNTSMSYFFQLMALISVNLGIINLFPIPVLDGGHIMFIVLEIINRGPVSRRKMEIAQQLGLSILLLLMFGALFNDFTRFF